MHNKNRSKKHHYLPRQYLRGFTNNQNLFFVYDKREDKILPKPVTPDAFFFENNLNTVIFPDGKTSDFLEGMYTNIEKTTRNSLNRIRQSDPNHPISLMDKMHLFLFLLFLYWRLPNNIKYVEELSKSFFSKGNDFNYFSLKNKSGEDVSEEIKATIKSSPAFKKTSKLLIPFAPFYHDQWINKLTNWKFIYTGDGGSWYPVGDNPFITKCFFDHDPVCCLDEFIFPVSGNVLLISANNSFGKNISREFIIQFGVSIIRRCQRFMACPKRDYLEALIEYYKIHAQFQKEDIIITEIFTMLEN